uniref:Cysteine-rich protein 1 n=1 Tax=Labrus bergylta TaxID=56723 RepID=A0A3Q3EXZ2_9LABR
MPKCPKCQKEVYFAERVTSLGKDWHRPCLKCEKCSKTLSAGSHAEVRHLKYIPRSQRLIKNSVGFYIISYYDTALLISTTRELNVNTSIRSFFCHV